MQDAAQTRPYAISMTGFLIGAAAFVMVVVQFVAGPFAPQENATLGEMAGNMARDAVDAFLRRDEANPGGSSIWDIDRMLLAAAMVAAVVALVLGVLGLVRHEAPRAVGAALAMGSFAIAFQFVASTIMMVLGVLVILGLIAMIGEIFGDLNFFGG